MAPTGSAPGTQARSQPNDSYVGFLKDNLEAIAVAVVMALVIKHFCVEAFKIPTNSMMPTLYGEGDRPGHPNSPGDRILVDKFAYLFSEPQRWDVIVFRYPLDRGRNFIKRIAGLPGERLRIARDGDLWVRPAAEGDAALRIPQKPRRVREQFYRRVYPPTTGRRALEDEGLGPDDLVRGNLERYWRAEEGPPNAWRLERHDLLVFGGGERGTLRNAAEIHDGSSPFSWALSGGSGELVRDVRFQFRLRTAAATDAEVTRFSLAWRPDGEYQAVLALSSEPGASRAFVRRGESVVREAALDLVLAADGSYDLEVEYVDGMVRVHVAGEEVAVLPDGRTFDQTRDTDDEQALTFEAEGGGLSVEALVIDRDLRYVNDWTGNPVGQQEGVEVPSDAYFMLGDNTRNSADSRRWRLTTVHLRGGRQIRYEHGQSEYGSGDEGGFSVKRVVDVDGLPRTWREDAEDGEQGSPTEPAPFVARELIVGRAFLVFWPCFPDFPGRLGLIH